MPLRSSESCLDSRLEDWLTGFMKDGSIMAWRSKGVCDHSAGVGCKCFCHTCWTVSRLSQWPYEDSRW